ncbi:MAG: ribosome biogenesis GTP-binding protein YihA/YsxC [Myxococcota bacterium]
MIKVVDAVFVTTATEPGQYPREPVPEVAFVGRSNVGKSSMINALAHRKKLVRVSNTPGRTKTLNFFDVTLERRATRKRLRLCDLPGYGFAKVSKVERDQWQKMISTYLRERHTLEVVVSIIDAEVGPTPDDLQMIDLLQEMPPRILVVATKLDRLGKAARRPRLDALARQLELPPGALLGFSATDGIGVDEVWGTVLAAIEGGGR